MRPLDDITVLTLEQAIAAPLTTRHLADLGARIIKIERPAGGDFARSYDTRARGLASHFVWTNRSKESLTLDLKHPAAASIVARLLSQTDVLVQNLAPGAAARLGFSAQKLLRDHPKLIVCDISGYGPDGPYRDKKAYDVLVQAEAGVLSVTGTPDQPVKTGIPVADIAAGMYAYSSILAALIQRGRTHIGCHIDVSMLEALTEWMQHPLYYCIDDGEELGRCGASHATIFPYGPFTAGDGGTVFIAIQNEREWEAFCRVALAQPELAANEGFSSVARRSENRDLLQGIIDRAFSSLTAAQILERLDEAQIANARMNTAGQLWYHEQLAARDCWREIRTPTGLMPALLPPGRSDAFEPRMDPVPALGEHTDAILGELGFSGDEIARLRAEGAV